MRLVVFSVFILVIFTNIAAAQMLDSVHYGWKVFEYYETIEGESEPFKRCYVMSSPLKSKTNYTANRDSYLSVTRFEHEAREEVSVSSGFEYKINANIYVLVGDMRFKMFTREDSAWLNSDVKDKEFILEMLKSDFVKVRSDSSFGSYSVDDYSLKGFARAYRRMKKLCS